MKRSIRSLSVATVLTLLAVPMLLLTGHGTAHAQSDSAAEQTERITLSPALSKPQLSAEETKTDKLTVINDGQTKYTFVLYARPFSVTGEQYDPNYTVVNKETEAYRWIQFDKTEFTLQPGERVEVPYTIHVPKEAASGGHYAVLFAETQPLTNNAQTNIARKKRVGTLLYMNVAGSIIQKGAVKSWDVTTWQRRRPIVSDIRIQNSGNTHFEADISAHYSDIFGGQKFTLNQQLLVLPGTIRRVPVSWSNSPSFGLYKASGTVNYLGKTETLPVKYILLLPIWAAWTLGAAVVILLGLSVRKRTKHAKQKSKTNKSSRK